MWVRCFSPPWERHTDKSKLLFTLTCTSINWSVTGCKSARLCSCLCKKKELIHYRRLVAKRTVLPAVKKWIRRKEILHKGREITENRAQCLLKEAQSKRLANPGVADMLSFCLSGQSESTCTEATAIRSCLPALAHRLMSPSTLFSSHHWKKSEVLVLFSTLSASEKLVFFREESVSHKHLQPLSWGRNSHQDLYLFCRNSEQIFFSLF